MEDTRNSMVRLDTAVVASADAVNHTAGTSPESGHPPVPAGFHAIRPPRGAMITNHDPNGLIANATPSTPAYDLIRILHDTGKVHQELQEEVNRVGARNDWLEVRNHWLEESSKLGRDELDRLVGIISRGTQEVIQQNGDIAKKDMEIARKADTIRQKDDTIEKLFAAQLRINAVVTGLQAQVNDVKKNLGELQKAQRAPETADEENEPPVARPVTPKTKDPARPAPKRKQSSADELEAAPVAGQEIRAGMPQRAQKPGPRLSSEYAQTARARDSTPDGYSKA